MHAAGTKQCCTGAGKISRQALINKQGENTMTCTHVKKSVAFWSQISSQQSLTSSCVSRTSEACDRKIFSQQCHQPL